MKLCHVSEFEDLFDLYADQAQLHYKPKARGNGHDDEWTDEPDGPRNSTDIEAMRYQGNPGMNEVFMAHMGSSLSKGDTVAETIERIVEAAERNCKDDPNRPHWRRDLAEKATWWIEKHPEWLYTALSRELNEAWRKAEGKRLRRLVWKSGRGLEVRSWGNGSDPAEEPRDEPHKEEPKENKPPRRIHLLPYDAPDRTLIPRRSWLYGFHYMRRIVSATVGPGGIGKSSLGLIEGVGMSTGRDLFGKEELEGAATALVSQRRRPARRSQPPYRGNLHTLRRRRAGGAQEYVRHLRTGYANQGGARYDRGEAR
jgi:hypothetical protein